MAIKYLAVLFFFALSVIFPIIYHFEPSDDDKDPSGHDGTDPDSSMVDLSLREFTLLSGKGDGADGNGTDELPPWAKDDWANHYLWIYVVFVYLFSLFGIWIILRETQKMIRIRQKYLAAQSSVSDRTIRLSGIPEDLRSEAKIKETIENLEIGKVESVTLCRNWTDLDDLMDEREQLLYQLEGAWTEYLGKRHSSKKMRRWYSKAVRRASASNNEDEERAGLLSGDDMDDGAHVLAVNRPRPEKRLWYGFMNLQSRRVDAIDYYEEKLRRQDERIRAARKKEYTAMPLAFVTLDSTAACQMACQAIIDPQPMQLMANPSPSPSGVVWRSTYLSRKTRMLRAWSITVFIFFLTIIWSFLLLPLATIQTTQSIKLISPAFAKLLDEHDNIASLIQTGVPTLLLAVLNVAVPYFYEYLSHRQGMTSLADIETSLVSKNFFFTFFNLFVVFTTLGTVTSAAGFLNSIDAHLRDPSKIAWTLRQGLAKMSGFYLNYLVLQTFGLFPFRLLQFGSVSLYPWYRLYARTPRDFSQLTQPGTFTYGFFIPQTLFILLVCVVYSVMRHTQLIQAFGLIYFALGSFIYKYQLLYAMDHRQFTTGRTWPMMCVRFSAALIVFQLVMIGQLAFKHALFRSILVLPLLIGTVFFTFWYRRTYEPLMKNIALRTLKEMHDEAEARMAESVLSGTEVMSGDDDEMETGYGGPRFRWPDPFPGGSAATNGVGGGRQGTRTRFVNPSLVRPLEEPWIARTEEREAEVQNAGVRDTGGEQ